MKQIGLVLRVVWGVLLLMALLLGCSSDADEPGVVSGAEKCTRFLSLYCDRFSLCVAPTDRARALEDCNFTLKLDSGCERVSGVTPNYDSCMRDLAKAECSDGSVILPSTCRGVFTQTNGGWGSAEFSLPSTVSLGLR